MTQIKQFPEQDISSAGAPMLDPEAMQEAVERYLANPIFRSARFEELFVEDNPYRRPVRPDDIGLVDFSTPLSRADAQQLSGLMGHRMLLNIHDTKKLMLPKEPTPAKWAEFEHFYGESNRVLGDLIRPYLEEHLFGFLRGEARPATRDRRALIERIGELQRRRRERAEELRPLLRHPERTGHLEMLAVQTLGTWINSDLQPPVELPVLSSAASHKLGLADEAGNGAANERRAFLEQVARSSGLTAEPHRYYQYYLPSTLALMNYVNSAALHPGRIFRLVGALIGHSLESEAMEALYAAEARDEFADALPARGASSAPEALAPVPEMVERAGGEAALEEVSRGLEEYACLLDVHHDDRVIQFEWINTMDDYVHKGRRLHQAIDEHGIDVDLDTFVESWEECSTTHVHDEDRLLVIESGQMDFWNCMGERHRYVPGDVTFIPKHRLHGSVVLSGECVYHQPVITPELDERYG